MLALFAIAGELRQPHPEILQAVGVVLTRVALEWRRRFVDKLGAVSGISHSLEVLRIATRRKAAQAPHEAEEHPDQAFSLRAHRASSLVDAAPEQDLRLRILRFLPGALNLGIELRPAEEDVALHARFLGIRILLGMDAGVRIALLLVMNMARDRRHHVLPSSVGISHLPQQQADD